MDGGGVLLDAGAGARRWCCRRPGRPRTRLWAARTDGAPRRRAAHRPPARAARPAARARPAATSASLRRLEKRGLVAIERAGRAPRAADAAAGRPRASSSTAEQAAALRGGRGAAASTCCTASPARARPRSTCAPRRAALERGEGVIVLVPEIALTPQTVARFQARFGDTVALLHSALGEGERYDEWRRLRSGEARIAVGPRSAVFAPGRATSGWWWSTRSTTPPTSTRATRATTPAASRPSAPRRSGRRAAGRARPRRGRRRGTRCRGSSCASASTAAPLPPVRVLDMRGSAHPLHPDTRRALGDARKAIVLLNRRGWSNFLTCRVVREGLGVPATATSRSCCTAPRTRSPATTAATASACPQRCDACGSLSVARHGAGTERVEAELRRGARRAGLPARRRHGGRPRTPCRELLARFHAAPAGLLLGTQMVAKGHDFPDVTLGVVLDADSTLRFPDFRAEERTFALIAQLAGRAGRGPARRPRARADHRAGRARDRGRRPPRRRRLPGRRARAPRARCATRRSPT